MDQGISLRPIPKSCLNGNCSSADTVVSGVPQGSVLGSLLFILYINDLPDELNSSCLMFADDSKVFRTIASDEDMVLLQEDLNRLEEWSRTWLLKFHQESTKSSISVSPQETMFEDTHTDFSVQIQNILVRRMT